MAIDEKSGWARAFLGGLAHLWRKSHATDADGAALFRSYCGVLVTPTLLPVAGTMTHVIEEGRVVASASNKCGNCERMLDAWRAEVLVPGMRELADAKKAGAR